MAKVTILHRDGSIDDYGNYNDAMLAADDYDLIQIWANLNEKIQLKDLVDVWICDGVVLDCDHITPSATITDNGSPVNCRVYGMGIIKNTYDSSPWYSCISITNGSSNVSIECDYIHGIGHGSYNFPFYSFQGYSVNITCNKFSLKCQKVYSLESVAISVTAQEINIKAQEVITGIYNEKGFGGTAILANGKGFINIDTALCRSLGHCLTVRGGEVTAQIRKMTSIMDHEDFKTSTLHMNQGASGTQKLVLYFDEINNKEGEYGSNVAFEIHQGTAKLIGRKVYAEDAEAVTIGPASHTPVNFNLICDRIESLRWTAMSLNSSSEKNFVKSNFIVGNNNGEGGVIFCFPNLATTSSEIVNAKLINTNSGIGARGICLFKNGSYIPKFLLKNLKIATYNDLIYYTDTSVDVFNFGLFGNKVLDANINLKIGDLLNFVFIESNDLT